MLAVCLFSCSMHNVKSEPQVDLAEFEVVRDHLYDCAMTICSGLAEYEGSCFYTDVDSISISVFNECRVPSLYVLLGILDQIDYCSSLYDVYDDDEQTTWRYYELREQYENYFNQK